MKRFAFCYHNGLGCNVNVTANDSLNLWCYQHFWTAILPCGAQIPSHIIFFFILGCLVFGSVPHWELVNVRFLRHESVLDFNFINDARDGLRMTTGHHGLQVNILSNKARSSRLSKLLTRLLFQIFGQMTGSTFFPWFSLKWILQAEVSPSDSVALTDHYVLNYKLG